MANKYKIITSIDSDYKFRVQAYIGELMQKQNEVLEINKEIKKALEEGENPEGIEAFMEGYEMGTTVAIEYIKLWFPEIFNQEDKNINE